MKKFTFLFTQCKNEWKEHNFQRQKKKSKKVIFTKTRNYSRQMKLMLIKETYCKDKSFKCFIGCGDDDDIKLLCIKLS